MRISGLNQMAHHNVCLLICYEIMVDEYLSNQGHFTDQRKKRFYCNSRVNVEYIVKYEPHEVVFLQILVEVASFSLTLLPAYTSQGDDMCCIEHVLVLIIWQSNL